MKIVYAVTTAQVGYQMVHSGTHWDAEDPVVRSQPSLFSEDPRYGLQSSTRVARAPDAPQLPDEPPVEAMTAAPGEKRSAVRRPSGNEGASS